MSYFLAPSLGQLRDEVNARYPRRDKTSDGWIGDPSHAARKSSHNPDWTAPAPRTGVVRAIDVDIDDNDASQSLASELVKACVGDPRVWYVIHQLPGKQPAIWSRTYGWEARLYTGSNPHDKHVHVSILETAAAEFDTTPWLEGDRPKRRPLPIDLGVTREQILRAMDLRDGAVENAPAVRRLQHALNLKTDAHLTLDGCAGRDTIRAYRAWEGRDAVPGRGRDGVPDRDSLAALVRGTRYRMTGV